MNLDLLADLLATQVILIEKGICTREELGKTKILVLANLDQQRAKETEELRKTEIGSIFLDIFGGKYD